MFCLIRGNKLVKSSSCNVASYLRIVLASRSIEAKNKRPWLSGVCHGVGAKSEWMGRARMGIGLTIPYRLAEIVLVPNFP